MSGLPGILGKIAEAAGVAAALKLAEERGGTVIHISPRSDSVLAKIVGAEAAAKIAEHVGTGIVTIPMAHVRGARGRRIAAARLSAQGLSADEIARAVDVHVRTVFRVRERERDAAQLPLFDAPLTTVRKDPKRS